MSAALPWILASLAFCLLGGAAALSVLHRLRTRRTETPDCIAAVPVFDAAQRRVFHELCAALPDRLVLAGLPLQRFCRAADAAQSLRLAALAVDFAICTPSGRVLAAIDLERGPPAQAESRREKARLLAGTSVRYLRCAAEAMPSDDELRRLAGVSDVVRHRPDPARRRDDNPWLDPLQQPARPAANDATPLPPWVRPGRHACEFAAPTRARPAAGIGRVAR